MKALTITIVSTLLLASLAGLSAAEPVTNSIGMKLVRIEAGEFTMGQDGPPVEDYLRQKRIGKPIPNESVSPPQVSRQFLL